MKDEHGQQYEPLEGERTEGDNEGDKRFHIGGVLTPEEVEKLAKELEPPKPLVR